MPFIHFGTIIAWVILIGDSAIWGQYFADNRLQLVLFYSVTLIFFSLISLSANVIRDRVISLVADNKFSWLSGMFLLLGTVTLLLLKVSPSTPLFIYIAAFLSALGLFLASCYVIYSTATFNFASTLRYFMQSIIVALVIYFVIHSILQAFAIGSLIALPIISIISIHLLNLQPAPEMTSEEFSIRHSLFTSVIESFMVLLIGSTFLYFHITKSPISALEVLPAQTNFFILLTLIIFLFGFSHIAQAGGRTSILRISTILLFVAALIFSILTTSYNHSHLVVSALVFWASVIYLCITSSIFIFQNHQLTNSLRIRYETINNILLLIIGIINLPVIRDQLSSFYQFIHLTNVESTWILMAFTFTIDFFIRAFGPKDALIYDPQPPSGTTTLLQTENASKDIKRLWMDAAATLAKKYKLTNRETQVIQLSAVGFSANNIAERLDISRYTVKTYMQRSYKKLEIRSHDELLNLLDEYI